MSAYPSASPRVLYRTGRTLGRTVYRGDVLIGMLDTREDAALVVEALNARERVLLVDHEAVGYQAKRADDGTPAGSPPDWPERTQCARPGCGHSSDAHVYGGPAAPSVTDVAQGFPCLTCDCPTMLRSEANYRALISKAPPGSFPLDAQ